VALEVTIAYSPTTSTASWQGGIGQLYTVFEPIGLKVSTPAMSKLPVEPTAIVANNGSIFAVAVALVQRTAMTATTSGDDMLPTMTRECSNWLAWKKRMEGDFRLAERNVRSVAAWALILGMCHEIQIDRWTKALTSDTSDVSKQTNSIPLRYLLRGSWKAVTVERVVIHSSTKGVSGPYLIGIVMATSAAPPAVLLKVLVACSIATV
jgi:hypothetical protein